MANGKSILPETSSLVHVQEWRRERVETTGNIRRLGLSVKRWVVKVFELVMLYNIYKIQSEMS